VQLAGAGYVIRQTSRLVLSRARSGVPDEVVELQRWERPP